MVLDDKTFTDELRDYEEEIARMKKDIEYNAVDEVDWFKKIPFKLIDEFCKFFSSKGYIVLNEDLDHLPWVGTIYPSESAKKNTDTTTNISATWEDNKIKVKIDLEHRNLGFMLIGKSNYDEVEFRALLKKAFPHILDLKK